MWSWLRGPSASLEEKALETAVNRFLNDNVLTSIYSITVPHIRQRQTWDCGIACLQMIGEWKEESVDWETIAGIIGTQSVWTVDLVHCLAKTWKLSLLYCSTNIGVNPDLQQLEYYRSAFGSDSVRVRQRFASLSQDALLETHSLTVSDIVALVSLRNVVAIALVDNTTFKYAEGPYVGHYVLLVGVSNQNELIVHNPSNQEPTTCTSLHFEKSWSANGTDQDIVFVANDGL